MDLYLPRYASPKNPHGIIPPSPPAETRERDWRAFERQLRSHSGLMPSVIAPGRQEHPRVILPGSPGYRQAVMSCMPTGLTSQRIPNKPQNANPLASLTDARVYWKMESTADATGNGNTLTAVGSPPAFNTGKVNNAAYVVENGGTQKYYTAADSASFKPGASTAFTINFWGYINSFSSQSIFIDRGVFAGNDPFNFYKGNNGHLNVNWSDGTNTDNHEIVVTVSDATWYMFTLIVVPGSTGTRSYGIFQQNASILASTTGTISGTAGTATCYIGRRGDGGTFPTTLDVRIDEFGLWGRAITGTEQNLLWNSGAGATVYP